MTKSHKDYKLNKTEIKNSLKIKNENKTKYKI